MTDILITNARLVNEGEIKDADVWVKNGHIEQIGSVLSKDNVQVIDARGKYLLPGMIDDQVHFREPGFEYKGELQTESSAAVAGGITSFFDMPNTKPQTITIEELERKFEHAANRCAANYAFYLGATNQNLDEIRKLKPGQTCGVKAFMGASTGNMLVDDPEVLDRLFRDCPSLIATHCEDSPTILANEKQMRARYGEDVPMEMHPKIRSHEACYKSSSLAVELAKKHGTKLHVLHLTTAEELALFRPGNVDDKQITAEACVHHLFFDDSRYSDKGGMIKCNPAIKSRADKDALRLALAEDVLDIIATDHAPHTAKEKANTYFKIPAGLPLVQHALPMALELYHDGILSLPQAVHKCAHAPAQLFGIKKRGFVREGYWADLVLVEMQQFSVKTEDLLYKCGWSPLVNERLRSRIDTTIVNGQIAWHKGALGATDAGRRIEFTT